MRKVQYRSGAGARRSRARARAGVWARGAVIGLALGVAAMALVHGLLLRDAHAPRRVRASRAEASPRTALPDRSVEARSRVPAAAADGRDPSDALESQADAVPDPGSLLPASRSTDEGRAPDAAPRSEARAADLDTDFAGSIGSPQGGEWGPDESERLRAAIQDASDPNAQALARAALSSCTHPEAARWVESFVFGSAPTEARVEMVLAAFDSRASGMREMLERTLDWPEPDVRDAAARAIVARSAWDPGARAAADRVWASVHLRPAVAGPFFSETPDPPRAADPPAESPRLRRPGSVDDGSGRNGAGWTRR